jgi:hypothetical protein
MQEIFNLALSQSMYIIYPFDIRLCEEISLFFRAHVICLPKRGRDRGLVVSLIPRRVNDEPSAAQSSNTFINPFCVVWTSWENSSPLESERIGGSTPRFCVYM